MRLVSSIFAVLVLSSLAGCATTGTQTSAASRSDETAVRAEARRISNTGPLAERGVVESNAAHRGSASL